MSLQGSSVFRFFGFSIDFHDSRFCYKFRRDFQSIIALECELKHKKFFSFIIEIPALSVCYHRIRYHQEKWFILESLPMAFIHILQHCVLPIELIQMVNSAIRTTRPGDYRQSSFLLCYK